MFAAGNDGTIGNIWQLLAQNSVPFSTLLLCHPLPAGWAFEFGVRQVCPDRRVAIRAIPLTYNSSGGIDA